MTKKTSSSIPHHVAIIPDGNRRWAKNRGLPSIAGHRAGFQAALNLFEAAQELGIETVSIWGFSTENWQRSPIEITYLMRLYEDYALKEWQKLGDRGVQLRVSGQFDRLPASLQKSLTRIIDETKDNRAMILNVCLSYGGRDELIRAVRKLIDGGVKSETVSGEQFEQALDTAGLPDIDFVIRTSGEQRTSGFFPWQAAYAELYFTPVMFPDFTPDAFNKAVAWFSDRQRRFGK